MSQYLIFDAETPPTLSPRHTVGVMGYVGGPRAARAWRLDEWTRFFGLKQFPIYVPDIGTNPLSQAREAVQLVLALGWSDKMTGPQKRAIIIDMETSADRVWWDKIATDIGAHGFVAVAYGSLSTVLDNAAEDVLAADWETAPVIPVGQTLHGSQYDANVPARGALVDYSMIDNWLYQRGGVGPRHKVAL